MPGGEHPDGAGRLWPGTAGTGQRPPGARLALVGLNVLAVLLLPVATVTLADAQSSRFAQGGPYSDYSWTEEQGVLNHGQQVCNIAAYDAEGQPLSGVQLFDQAGRPLDMACPGQANRKVPWVLGDVTRWNVFPMGERVRLARNDAARSDLGEATFPTPDRATVPPVTNPLVVPEPAEETDAGKKEPGGSESDETAKGKPRDGRAKGGGRRTTAR